MSKEKAEGTLGRLFRLYPVMRAWVENMENSLIWETSAEAKRAISCYVGPDADPEVLEVNHIRNPGDIAFVRSQEAHQVVCALVDEAYGEKRVPGEPILEKFLG